jgi:hypothetical protein
VLTALADRTTAHPKRTLLAVIVFVVLAGIFGGPVAGALEESGGFTATDSGSARAVDRIEAATGTDATPGVVALLRTPSGAESATARARIAAVGRTLAALGTLTVPVMSATALSVRRRRRSASGL